MTPAGLLVPVLTLVFMLAFLLVFLLATSATDRHIERSMRQNFAAAGLLLLLLRPQRGAACAPSPVHA